MSPIGHQRDGVLERLAGGQRRHGLARDLGRASGAASLKRCPHQLRVGHDQRRGSLERREDHGVDAVRDHDRRELRQLVVRQTRDDARAHRVQHGHAAQSRNGERVPGGHARHATRIGRARNR
jgi:hypothetical protein